jgi:serine/threonine protein kinase
MTSVGVVGPASDLFGKLGLTDAREIGRGATCTVYVAHESRLSRQVAVKHFTRPIADDKQERRFLRECQTLAGLQHPNILTLHLNGLDDSGRPYIVMEYCPNGSLADLLAESGPMSVSEATRIGIKLCSALQRAHDKDVLHRDIKPANVLLTELGEPKLADFGIAGDPSEMSVTVGDSLTPLYAAPEVLEDGGGSGASDVWSLASMLYALLLGRAPYAATGATREGFLSLLERIVRDPVPLLSRTDVPPLLVQVLTAGMEKDPTKRIPAAREFARCLQEVQQACGEPMTEYLEVGSTGRFATEDLGTTIPTSAGIPRQPVFDSGTKSYFASPPAEVSPPVVSGPTTMLRAQPPAPVVPVAAAPARRRWPIWVAAGGTLVLAAAAVALVELHGSGTSAATAVRSVKTGTVNATCNGLKCTLALKGVESDAGAQLNWQIGPYETLVSASSATFTTPTLPGPGKYPITVTETNGSGTETLVKATSSVTISAIHRSVSVAKLSDQAIDLLIDSPSTKCSQDQLVTIDTLSGKAWRRVRRVRVSGNERLLTLGAGDYRATLRQGSISAGVCVAATSRTVHLQGAARAYTPAATTPVYTAPVQPSSGGSGTTGLRNPVAPTTTKTTLRNPVAP